MSRGQRLTFLGIAAAIAVVAVIVLAGGDDETDRAADPARTPATTPAEAEPQVTATPKPKPQPPLLQAGEEKTLTFTQGKTVRFRVRHDEAEEVHVHGYDIARDLEPNQTKTIEFEATIPGIFEVELEHSGTLLGRLKVEP
jgi:ABC-type glycerol-3-phosphate transport system substrate-binding protein